jgi:DNA-binding beta-propeller fold protein YncE
VADSIANLFTKVSTLTSHATDTSHVRGADTTNTAIGKSVLTFGDSGIGPGLFTDARSVALDARGNIYVAEYLGGSRVQRFDSTGHYLSEWRPVSPKHQIFGIAADRRGDVYVAGDSLVEYNGETGALVRVLRYRAGAAPRDVQVSPTGTVVSAWQADSDDVALFDDSGKLQRRIGAAVSLHNDGSERANHVAVDGSGNVYAFDTYGSAIYKFSAEGKYLSQFGSDGTNSGQFHRLLAVAVDGHGRVYASDMLSIQVFDSGGRFLRRVESPSEVMGMAFDDSGALYVVGDNKVTKFNIAN